MIFFKSLLVTVAIVMFIGCGQAPEANSTARNATPAPPATQQPETAPVDLMAQGRKLYSDNCAACHKQDGKGGKVTIEGKTINPDDLTSAKIKNLADDKIYGYIYKGIEEDGMPSFKDKLSEAEIREVVKFLRAEIQKLPQATTQKPISQ